MGPFECQAIGEDDDQVAGASGKPSEDAMRERAEERESELRSALRSAQKERERIAVSSAQSLEEATQRGAEIAASLRQEVDVLTVELQAAQLSAAKADERRISDIERFLASSERSLFQQRLQPQGQPQQPQQLQLSQAASASAGSAAAQQVQPQPTAQPQNQQRPKISSLAASAPSLTSILSAPPLATPSGRPQPS